MSNYQERFTTLNNALFNDDPSPEAIESVSSCVEISKRIAAESCFNVSRTRFKSFTKTESNNSYLDSIFLKKMPPHTWRYFKFNCCVHANRYDEPQPYNQHNAKNESKKLSHIALDLVRHVNNWHNLNSWVVYNEETQNFEKNLQDLSYKYCGLAIDISKVKMLDNEEQDNNIAYLLSSVDRVSGDLGFTSAESLFKELCLGLAAKKVSLV